MGTTGAIAEGIATGLFERPVFVAIADNESQRQGVCFQSVGSKLDAIIQCTTTSTSGSRSRYDCKYAPGDLSYVLTSLH